MDKIRLVLTDDLTFRVASIEETQKYDLTKYFRETWQEMNFETRHRKLPINIT